MQDRHEARGDLQDVRSGETELMGICTPVPDDRLIRALADNSNLKKDNANLRADNEALRQQNERQASAIVGYRNQIRGAFTRVVSLVADIEDTSPSLARDLQEIAMGGLRIGLDPEKPVVGK